MKFCVCTSLSFLNFPEWISGLAIVLPMAGYPLVEADPDRLLPEPKGRLDRLEEDPEVKPEPDWPGVLLEARLGLYLGPLLSTRAGPLPYPEPLL